MVGGFIAMIDPKLAKEINRTCKLLPYFKTADGVEKRLNG